MFVDNVKDILIPTPWTMNFADIVYQAKDGSTFEIEATKGGGEGKISYKFIYCDKYESVLLEAKCSVKKDYITIRVDYLDERCDLLPAGAAVGDVIPIPYLGADKNTPENIYLWWNSKLHAFKSFHMKREVLFTDLLISSAFYCADENENSTRCIHKIAFTQDEMTVTKKKNVYTVKAMKEIDDISFTLEFQFDYEGTDIDDGSPIMSNLRSLDFSRILLSGYQPTAKISYWSDVFFTLSDIEYIGYIDCSQYTITSRQNDKYVRWGGTDVDEDYKMNDFTAYLKAVKDGSTKQYHFVPKYGGSIDIRGFYQCDDINEY